MDQSLLLPLVLGGLVIILGWLLAAASRRAAASEAALQAARSAEHAIALREIDAAARASSANARLGEVIEEREALIATADRLRDEGTRLSSELAQSRTAMDMDREAGVRAAADTRDRLAALQGERDQLSQSLADAREAGHRLATDLAQARLAAEKDREAAARDVEQLRQLRDEMSNQFKAMSAETLRSQAEDTKRAQSETLAALLTPFREQVHRFQTELQTRESQAGQERERLRTQIEFLHQRSEDISREAVALTRALKGDKQAQGAWGEMILHRLLEQSGLEEGTHYIIHEKRHDEDGRRFHPDVVVQMPRGRKVVVDSKCSLIAYETSVNAEDEVVRAAALADHVRAVRAHISALSGKAYQTLDTESVDYVVMFLPIESAFADALRADPDLTTFAMSKRIVLSPPSNLMLMLRTIEHIWMVEKRESNAAEIADRAGKLYDKVATFVASMEDAGKAITKASEAHDRAMGQLSRGSGNVIRQVEKLRELGARATKRISLNHDRRDGASLLSESEQQQAGGAAGVDEGDEADAAGPGEYIEAGGR